MLWAEAINWSQLGDDKDLRLRLICFYLCLSWELYLDQEEVSEQVEALLKNAGLSAYQRWVVELYQEERTSLEDGRAAFARLKAIVRRYRNGKNVREMLLSLIPEHKQGAAVRHPLMGDFIGHRAGPTHLFSTRRASIAKPQDSADQLPKVEREAAFDEFLKQTGFLESFELYWRQPPKNRDNKRTRVLVLAAAIVALITPMAEDSEEEAEMGLLQRRCHFSAETCEAIMRICHRIYREQLNTTWIARSFVTDATEADRMSYEHMVKEAAEDETLPPNYRLAAKELLAQFY